MLDLHMHSTHSDGDLSVLELHNMAIANNISVLSITDHDNIASVGDILNNDFYKALTYIPGVELSTVSYYLKSKVKIHLLGYGFDYNNKILNQKLQEIFQWREIDNYKYIELLLKNNSYLPNSLFQNFEYGKYGWIKKLILKEVENKISTADLQKLITYLDNNKPIYQKYNFDVVEAINFIHAAGGYAVMAHPHETKLDFSNLSLLVKHLVLNNLDGIETYHIDASKDDMAFVHKLAMKYNLYETGGTDFHSLSNSLGIGKNLEPTFTNGDLALVRKIIKEKKIIGESHE